MTLRNFISYGCFNGYGPKANYDVHKYFDYYVKLKEECKFSKDVNELEFEYIINNYTYRPSYVIIDNKFVVVKCAKGNNTKLSKHLELNGFELLTEDVLDIKVSMNHIVKSSNNPGANIIYKNGILNYKPAQEKFNKILESEIR